MTPTHPPRSTSTAAFNAIRASGMLSKRRWEAYEALHRHGPMTGQELARLTGTPGMWKRCSELETLGLARPLETRPCGVTGRDAIVWALTDRTTPLTPGDKPTDTRLWVAFSDVAMTMGTVSSNRGEIAGILEDMKQDDPDLADVEVVEVRIVRPKKSQ